MGIKSLFFENGDKKETKKVDDVENVSFKNDAEKGFSFDKPFSFTKSVIDEKSTTVKITPDNINCEPHMESILKIYENGLESLNMPGYDFFEFYKAINQLGPEKSEVYQMAYTMAKTMDSNVTKDNLLSQSQFYISEISKVHKQYIDNGLSKKNSIISEKTNVENSLKSEISKIESEISRLKVDLITKQQKISEIENTFNPKLMEIDCKIMANDIAKDKTIGSIETVVNGITKNIR